MLDWNQLAVVTTPGQLPNKVHWKARPEVFSAETCARHIYVGLAQDFQDIPSELFVHKDSHSYRGKEAYRFFLEFYAGLRSHHHADKETSGQTRTAWNVHVRDMPEESQDLKPYMDALFHDGKLIKSTILQSHLRRPTLTNTAVEVATMRPDSRVLVVCGAEQLSIDMIKSLGQRKPFTPNVLYVTHPDLVEQRKILRTIQDLRNFNKLKADIRGVPFHRVINDSSNITTLYNANAVFVCQPNSDRPDSPLTPINNDLYDAWLLRKLIYPHHQGILVHLKGDPMAQGAATGVWTEPLDDVVSFYDLRESHGKRFQFVKEIVGHAKQAIADLATFRVNGDKAVQISFDSRKREDISLAYTIARRPAGPGGILAELAQDDLRLGLYKDIPHQVIGRYRAPAAYYGIRI